MLIAKPLQTICFMMQATMGTESLSGLTHSQKLALDTIDKGHKVLADLASAGEPFQRLPLAILVAKEPLSFMEPSPCKIRRE